MEDFGRYEKWKKVHLKLVPLVYFSIYMSFLMFETNMPIVRGCLAEGDQLVMSGLDLQES